MRKIGCHVTCKVYLDWKERHLRKNQKAEYDYQDYTFEAVNRMKGSGRRI